MRTVTCHLPPIGSVARHSTRLTSRQWPPNLDILVHAYERWYSIWKSDKTMFFKPGLGHLSGPRDLVWGTSLPSSVTHQHSSPCKLHCISMYSPDELQQWESLRWSQVLLWILWQQQLSRSKLMLLLLFLSSKKTVYRFIAYMMNPHRQFKQKQLERQLQFFIADSNLIQNQTAAVHVRSTSRNYYSKGLHNFKLCDSKKLNLFVIHDW